MVLKLVTITYNYVIVLISFILLAHPTNPKLSKTRKNYLSLGIAHFLTIEKLLLPGPELPKKMLISVRKNLLQILPLKIIIL